MNTDKQRITIAEACGKGWRLADDGWWDGPNGNEGVNYERMLDHLPDYLNDLNAMHEAEKVLAEADVWWKFCTHLNAAVCADADEPRNQDPETLWCMIHATATQRAEAFIRTIGKWEDDE